MKGPTDPNSTLQFELSLIRSKSGNNSLKNPKFLLQETYKNITLAVRGNFLLQKGDEHNSAIISLRDSLDGPQEIHLELVLRLHTNGNYAATYISNLIIFVSGFRTQTQHKHNAKRHHLNHF